MWIWWGRLQGRDDTIRPMCNEDLILSLLIHIVNSFPRKLYPFIVLLPARNDCAYPLVLLLVLVLLKKKKQQLFFANPKGKIVCYFIVTQFWLLVSLNSFHHLVFLFLSFFIRLLTECIFNKLMLWRQQSAVYWVSRREWNVALDGVAHTVYWRRDTCNKINQKTDDSGEKCHEAWDLRKSV